MGWKGRVYQIVQMRDGARIWHGFVTATRSGASSYGRRKSDDNYNQWEVGDVILLGTEPPRGFWRSHAWKIDDTIALGSKDDVFDETILRVDAGRYPSVAQAVSALNSGGVICNEGICIAYVSERQEFVLLIRKDRKAEGLRVYCEVAECDDVPDGATDSVREAAPEFQLGRRVAVLGQAGTVRFVGTTQFAPGQWVGIELDQPVGQNDGSVQGVVYFGCKPPHGVFMRPENVTAVSSR